MQILILKEKYGDSYSDVSTEEKFFLALSSVVTHRLKRGYYDEEEALDIKEWLKSKNTKSLFSFLLSRRNHEYEYIEHVEVTQSEYK